MRASVTIQTTGVVLQSSLISSGGARPKIKGSRLSKQPNLKAAKESRPWSSGGGARPCGRRPANAQRVNRTSTRAQQEGRGSHQPGKTAARRKQKPETEVGRRPRTDRRSAGRASRERTSCAAAAVLRRLCCAGCVGWAAEYLDFTFLLGRVEVWRGPYLAITGPPPLLIRTVQNHYQKHLENHTQQNKHQHFILCLGIPIIIMWKRNPFGGKAHSGLDGRTIVVRSLKISVRNVIAQGGFSCVYLACDTVHPSKMYALKHIICNDSESLDLVMKEIQVMNLLKGHPNVVTLVAHDVVDMGRTKEALLVMEFCEKSLVSAMESRGSGYYEEKKVLLIFRDVCNAVFAMHGQSLPIAHRDLKAENVLLGSDGAWKICDFGSTSTNHKCFNKPEEMGIEEDVIRKHTTPDYRAPEMWDLYRREVISEKVDIWALGCLLYRICYFKSAFDGESKLQVLNGNYHIPEQPKYSIAVTGLIKDMLEASPNARPDITQVWFRVNELLSLELQKRLPDGPSPAVSLSSQDEGAHKRTPVMPRRNPPPPREQSNSFLPHGSSKAGDAPLGAFWATQHAQGAQAVVNRNPLFDGESIKAPLSSKQNQSWVDTSISIPGNRHDHSGQMSLTSKAQNNSLSNNGFRGLSDTEIQNSGKSRAQQPQPEPKCEKDPFNSFVADFDTHNLNIAVGKASELELEVSNLKEQLKKTTLEKAEMTAKHLLIVRRSKS
ncbi:Protein kinase superfamily protein [Zea mays]|uniref:non-specific serine/threonine protein kinase n=1 Tax=Zea mays TaxID=4577 RepID=A0A1D6HBW8_MAIZE|nr:Protein kinase superfamily protein [Zea mays]